MILYQGLKGEGNINITTLGSHRLATPANCMNIIVICATFIGSRSEFCHLCAVTIANFELREEVNGSNQC